MSVSKKAKFGAKKEQKLGHIRSQIRTFILEKRQ